MPESRPAPLETSDHCRSPSAKRSSTTVHWQSETVYFVTKCQKMIITWILQVITNNMINYIKCTKIYVLENLWKSCHFYIPTCKTYMIFHTNTSKDLAVQPKLLDLQHALPPSSTCFCFNIFQHEKISKLYSVNTCITSQKIRHFRNTHPLVPCSLHGYKL